MKTIRSFVLALVALLAIQTAAFAQTTVNTTTTTAAVTATQQIIPLASVTNVAVKDWIFFDAEAAQVNAIDTTALTVTVRRGIQSTAGRPHASGVVVYTGPARRYYLNDVVGQCTAANEEFLPHINVTNGTVYQCSNSEWVLYRRNGFRETMLGRSDGGTTYTAAGAITIQPGVQFIGSAGALAMTLANPTTEQNGMIMILKASTAQAHTVTYTAGFDGRGASTDVATWTAAIGNHLTVIAVNGIWWILSISGVTPA